MPRSSDPRSPATREVREGDTLTDIAVRSGVDPDALVRANPALVTRDLRPGDVINIPPEAATASAARSFAVPAAELSEDDPERGAAATAGNAEATSPTSSSASPAYSSSTPNPDHVRDDAARASPGRPPPIRAPAVKLPGDYFRELGERARTPPPPQKKPSRRTRAYASTTPSVTSRTTPRNSGGS